MDEHLNAKGNIFAIGDCAWVEIDGNLATKTGLEAKRQAKYLAGHFRNMIRGRAFERYSVRGALTARWRSFLWARTARWASSARPALEFPRG